MSADLIGINTVLHLQGTSCILIKYANNKNSRMQRHLCLAVNFSVIIGEPFRAFIYYIVVDKKVVVTDLYSGKISRVCESNR